MLEIASQITICLLLAALIGFIIGYLLGKMSKSNTTNNTVTNVEKQDDVSSEDKAIEEKMETLASTISKETKEEEVKIPTSPAIEDVAIALEKIEAEETSIKPDLLDAPKDNKKDPLTTIKGIGPKVEEQLNAAGIFHFEQIANWNEANIKWLETHTTFAHRAKKDLWVNQAKALIS